jgi:hypothetical protein
MSRFTIIFLLLTSPAFAGDWSAADRQREATFLTLHTVDWLQTRTIAKQNYYYEQNAILGRHPSIGKVNVYFASTALAHYLIADRLSPEWRKGFQYISIGISGGAVLNNISLGIRLDL